MATSCMVALVSWELLASHRGWTLLTGGTTTSAHVISFVALRNIGLLKSRTELITSSASWDREIVRNGDAVCSAVLVVTKEHRQVVSERPCKSKETHSAHAVAVIIIFTVIRGEAQCVHVHET